MLSTLCGSASPRTVSRVYGGIGTSPACKLQYLCCQMTNTCCQGSLVQCLTALSWRAARCARLLTRGVDIMMPWTGCSERAVLCAPFRDVAERARAFARAAAALEDGDAVGRLTTSFAIVRNRSCRLLTLRLTLAEAPL